MKPASLSGAYESNDGRKIRIFIDPSPLLLVGHPQVHQNLVVSDCGKFLHDISYREALHIKANIPFATLKSLLAKLVCSLSFQHHLAGQHCVH